MCGRTKWIEGSWFDLLFGWWFPWEEKSTCCMHASMHAAWNVRMYLVSQSVTFSHVWSGCPYPPPSYISAGVNASQSIAKRGVVEIVFMLKVGFLTPLQRPLLVGYISAGRCLCEYGRFCTWMYYAYVEPPLLKTEGGTPPFVGSRQSTPPPPK